MGAKQAELKAVALQLHQGCDQLDGKKDGIVDITVIGTDGMIKAMYKAKVMDTSSVDVEKNAYFAAMMKCYSRYHAKTEKWTEAHAEGFLKFMFTSRSLFAASIINRGSWQ